MNKELLTQLCGIDGVSGHEDAVRGFILEQLKATDTPKEVTVDAMGNVLVHLFGKQPAAHVVQMDAHMDEVGVIITHIRPDGMLRFATLGSVDSQVLFGCRVRFGKQIGVIGGKAVHQCGGDDKKKVPSVDHMVIDIGCVSAEEAEKLVRVGDTGTFDNTLTWLQDDLFCGKAVDDRMGCTLLLELASEQPERDIWLSFSVQEEIGLRGAGVAAEAIQPEIAIAIDSTTAGDTAGSTPDTAVCCMGSGAVVSFADRATLYDAALYRKIRELGDANGIPTQTKNRVAGANNAGAIQRSHTGVQMAAVSLPCRYLHSPSCMGRVSDGDAMLSLLRLLAEELTK
ncbi:MAG: M42 family peptidase [Clostridia bacterium]|nr:M42 family peptidase [Clostridia bacterium]